MGEGLRSQKSLGQVFQEAGISRRHAYRLLNTKF
jgi:DNA-binding phage protein